jgi:hypothetical protein
MCSYSMIADHYGQKWRDQYPGINDLYRQPGGIGQVHVAGFVSKGEFDALKKEVADLKELLIKAKEYDARTGQPDCEAEDKTAILRAVAKLVGIDIEGALPNAPTNL